MTFGSGLYGYNNAEPDATMSQKLTTAFLYAAGAGASTHAIGKVRLGDELVSEKIARAFVDDYGLSDEYKLIRNELRLNNNSYASKFLNLAKESAEKLDDKERKIFYNLMTGDLKSLDGLSEEGIDLTIRARKLISEMGEKYVQEGLLDPKTFQRNAATYLHRTYQRSLKDPKLGKAVKAARQISIIGDNLKPRGTKSEKISRSEFNDPTKKYQKEKYYIIDDDGKSKDVLVRRDYTKSERLEMGEIEDLAFALAETGRLMSNDVATAQFFNKIARNKNFTLTPEEYAIRKPDNFVLVDEKGITGKPSVKRYGELAGKYVHKDVYRDITKLYKLRDPSVMQGVFDSFEKLQRTWKLSKTAWNPATHVNNTVSNFILLDFADTDIDMLV